MELERFIDNRTHRHLVSIVYLMIWKYRMKKVGEEIFELMCWGSRKFSAESLCYVTKTKTQVPLFNWRMLNTFNYASINRVFGRIGVIKKVECTEQLPTNYKY